jgi:hypothetical protein
MVDLQEHLEKYLCFRGCHWTRDEDGTWNTQCGQTYLSIDGSGPAESNFKCCPYCGKTLIEKSVITQRVLTEGLQFHVQGNIENGKHPADGIDGFGD